MLFQITLFKYKFKYVFFLTVNLSSIRKTQNVSTLFFTVKFRQPQLPINNNRLLLLFSSVPTVPNVFVYLSY